MNTRKSTKRALMLSCLSLLLCISMLVGSTFAWFTDTASTGVNTIQSGNLDLVLEYRNAAGEWEEVTKDTLLFKDGALYEPGYTEVAYLRVSNAGSLHLKYTLSVDVANEVTGINKAGETFKLSDYIKFAVVTSEVNKEATKYETREEALEDVAGKANSLKTYATDDYIALAPAEAIEMALVVFMPTTVGNEANHNGVNVPSITMGVNVFATQKDAESDSYGPNYDLTAPALVTVDGYPTTFATIDDAFEATGATTFNVSGPVDMTKMSKVFSGKTKAAGQTVTFNQIKDAPVAYYDFSNTAIQANDANIVINGGYIQGKPANTANGFGFHATTGTITYNNVTINDCWTNENWATVTYNNCTFTGTYYVYSYSVPSITFTNCVFDKEDSRALIIYSHGNNPIVANITDCTFKADSKGYAWGQKWTAAVEVDTTNIKDEAGATVNISNCTAEATYNGIVRDKSPTTGRSYITVNGNPVVTSQATFQKAIDEKKENITLAAGSYTMVNTDYDVTISGPKEAVLSLPNGVKGSKNTVTFEGITINGYASNSTWYTTQLNGAEKAIYKNCTINDLITTYCPSDFIGCEFVNHSTESADWYSVFDYGVSEVNITDCTFNTTASKAVKLYNEGASDSILNVTNCIFNGSFFDKAAIEIDSSQPNADTKGTYRVNITNCVMNEWYTDLWRDTSNNSVVTVNGAKFIAQGLAIAENGDYLVTSAAGLVNFEKMVNEDNQKFDGKTVKLTADIDMAGINWTPITQTGSTAFVGIFDGQGYTISNLSIDDEDKKVLSNGENVYSVGLFGFLEGGATIKNIKIDGAKVSGHHNVGVIAGYISSGVTIENCDVTNATVLCTHSASDTCGDKAGVIVGIVGANSCYVKDCDVSNSTVTAGRDAGQIIGSWTTLNNDTEHFSGCTAQNVDVTATGDCDREGNINKNLIGRLN